MNTGQTGNPISYTYVGAVAHFSFWASGQLTQSITLHATFKDSSGASLSNNLVTITSAKNGVTNGYTDSSGTISGLVPAGDTLVLKVFNQNGEIYSKASDNIRGIRGEIGWEGVVSKGVVVELIYIEILIVACMRPKLHSY